MRHAPLYIGQIWALGLVVWLAIGCPWRLGCPNPGSGWCSFGTGIGSFLWSQLSLSLSTTNAKISRHWYVDKGKTLYWLIDVYFMLSNFHVVRFIIDKCVKSNLSVYWWSWAFIVLSSLPSPFLFFPYLVV